MRKLFVGCLWLVVNVWLTASFLACGRGSEADAYLRADSLNRESYEQRYKDLQLSERAAREALQVGKGYSSIKAEALNNLAFCAFIRMDFERADSLLQIGRAHV